MRSIRRYLVQTLALIFVTAAGVAVTAAYLITDHELEEILDTQLSQHSRIVAGQITPDMSREEYARIARHLSIPGHPARLYRDGEPLPMDVGEIPATLYHEEERKLTLGFWNRDGSPRLLGAEWNDAGAFPAPEEEGYRWVKYNGKHWRVFSLFDAASATWVSMGLRNTFHKSLVERVTWNNLLPMLIMLPVLLWLMARIIRRGLAPIGALSNQVQGRDARDLRLVETQPPRELAGLQQSLNDFITRLGQTLARERRFTADAAHELRTPLAALKIHLDNARAGEKRSLDKAYIGVERLQRVVEQLLVLARLDRSASTPPQVIDIYPVVVELMADLWPLAHARQQYLTLSGLKHLEVCADPVEIGILLRNLLDNALRYTPDGAHVEIELGQAGDSPQLIVRDTGPGIPEALIDKVTERFRRAADQRTTGSGLGLSIVLELVQRQRAQLHLKNRRPHGLEACIEWLPPARQGAGETQRDGQAVEHKG
ncbi:ATP-binding protein [Halomonas sp. WWR20]